MLDTLKKYADPIIYGAASLLAGATTTLSLYLMGKTAPEYELIGVIMTITTGAMAIKSYKISRQVSNIDGSTSDTIS
jgi:hypothetical protein